MNTKEKVTALERFFNPASLEFMFGEFKKTAEVEGISLDEEVDWLDSWYLWLCGALAERVRHANAQLEKGSPCR